MKHSRSLCNASSSPDLREGYLQALRQAGFVVFDQEGSHVYLHLRIGDRFTHRVTVPVHGKSILKLKTLKSILKAADLTISKFNDHLRG